MGNLFSTSKDMKESDRIIKNIQGSVPQLAKDLQTVNTNLKTQSSIDVNKIINDFTDASSEVQRAKMVNNGSSEVHKNSEVHNNKVELDTISESLKTKFKIVNNNVSQALNNTSKKTTEVINKATNLLNNLKTKNKFIIKKQNGGVIDELKTIREKLLYNVQGGDRDDYPDEYDIDINHDEEINDSDYEGTSINYDENSNFNFYSTASINTEEKQKKYMSSSSPSDSTLTFSVSSYKSHDKRSTPYFSEYSNRFM